MRKNDFKFSDIRRAPGGCLGLGLPGTLLKSQNQDARITVYRLTGLKDQEIFFVFSNSPWHKTWKMCFQKKNCHFALRFYYIWSRQKVYHILKQKPTLDCHFWTKSYISSQISWLERFSACLCVCAPLKSKIPRRRP